MSNAQALQRLLYAHLADELAAEGVDDTGDRRSLALADEVEIEHALHRSRLQAAVRTVVSTAVSKNHREYLLDKASCLGVEEGVVRGRAHRPTWSCETADVVVGRVGIESSIGAVCASGGAIRRWSGGRHGGGVRMEKGIGA